MSEILVKIDGKDVEARAGMTILEAAQTAGIEIPTLCHHDKLEPFGGMPSLHRRSTGWRLDKTRCFLRVYG